MGACATKSGDLKVKGEPPLDVEDAVKAPPVVEGEKMKKADDGVRPAAAAEADPADVSRRRSLSDLLKEEDVEASDGEAAQEAVKFVSGEDGSAGATDGAGVTASLSKEEGEAAREPQVVPVELEPPVTVVEQDTAEQPTDDPKGGQEPGGEAQPAMIEEKRVDPDSVQVPVAAAPPAEGSEVADGHDTSA